MRKICEAEYPINQNDDIKGREREISE